MTEATQTGSALDTVVAELLQTVVDNVGQAKDFLISEIPDVLQQVLWWNAMEGLYYVVLGLLFTVTGMYFCRPSKWSVEKSDLVDKHGIGPTFKGILVAIYGVLFGVVIGPIMFFENVLTPLQIWVAPKVWLIEYAAHLAK